MFQAFNANLKYNVPKNEKAKQLKKRKMDIKFNCHALVFKKNLDFINVQLVEVYNN